MDSIRDDLNYFPSKSDSISRKYRSAQDLSDERDEVDEIRLNVRSAMKEARRKMANLRHDAEEKDRRLSEEQRLRQQLERELSEKSEELLREKSKSLRSSGGGERMTAGDSSRYSTLDYTLACGGDGFLQDELDSSKALNFQKERGRFDSGVDSVYDEEDADQVSTCSQCKCDNKHLDRSWEQLALNDIKSIKELLNRITASQSPRSIDKQGSLMADKIKSVQKTQQRAMAEELKSVMEERDEAVCKAQLLSSQHERDASFRKTKRLEEELETIRVYYSLHRSLTQEQNLRDQFNSTMDNFEGRLRSRESELVLAQRSYDDLVAKLRSVSSERNTLASQLQETNKNCQQEKQRADKLERLVGVLRKRITSEAASIETIN
ncbi:hypothetical protein QZH41_001035 [Actinostola sp. cb2023]|nr:hypothetical protein QZH41_001035 [Actinostola sp. cb2023]